LILLIINFSVFLKGILNSSNIVTLFLVTLCVSCFNRLNKNDLRSVSIAQLVNVFARWALLVRPNEFASLSNAHIFPKKEINSSFVHTIGSDFYIFVHFN